MNDSKAENNKAIVLEAFDTLFNKRDYTAAERFWSPNYIQHSAHIEPGRDGLFNLIKSIPPTLRYEPGVIVAEGDVVIIHGRFSGFGLPVNWIAADIIRVERRNPGRALGCHSGRGYPGTVQERKPNVWRLVPRPRITAIRLGRYYLGRENISCR